MVDKIDQKIIAALQENGRVPYSTIAKEVGLTATAVGQRVQKMIADEIIEGFSVSLNQEKLGIHLEAIVTLKIEFSKITAFNKKLKSIEEIKACYRVTGEDCMIMKVHLRNNKHLVDFLNKVTLYGTTKTNIIIDQLV